MSTGAMVGSGTSCPCCILVFSMVFSFVHCVFPLLFTPNGIIHQFCAIEVGRSQFTFTAL